MQKKDGQDGKSAQTIQRLDLAIVTGKKINDDRPQGRSRFQKDVRNRFDRIRRCRSGNITRKKIPGLAAR